MANYLVEYGPTGTKDVHGVILVENARTIEDARSSARNEIEDHESTRAVHKMKEKN